MGGRKGLWTDPTKWSPPGVPTASDNVSISVDGTYTVTLSGSRSVNSLTVGATGNIGVQTLWIQSTGGISAALTVADGLTNSGTITLETTSSSGYSNLTVTSGTLVNNGTINVNTGTGGTRTISAHLTNNGTININTSTTLSKSSGVYTNTGTINIAAGKTLDITGASQVFNQNGGTLSCVGTFDMTSATFNFNGGNIGGTPQLTASTLNIGPGGTSPATISLRQASNFSGNITAGQNILVNSLSGITATMTAATGFTNSGNITLETMSSVAPSNLWVTSGTLVNNGTINVNAGTGGARTISAHLANSGTININTGTTFSKSSGVYTNQGTINIAAGKTLDITGASQVFRQEPPGTVTGAGTLDLTSITFYGVGTITANVINNSSQFNAGSSPGILNIVGNYTQSAGALNVQVGGRDPGTGFDQLNVSGTASLAGTLNVSLIGGFLPDPGDKFTFLTYGSKTGDFTSTTGVGVDLGSGIFFRRWVTATDQTLITYNTIKKISIYPTAINVSENGATATYRVVLVDPPTADVTVSLVPDSQVNGSPSPVVFPLSNWGRARTVTVTAVDDAIPEGPHVGTIRHTSSSADAAYNNLTLSTVTAHIADNDTDVSIAKTDSPDPVLQGSSLTYTLSVFNGSPYIRFVGNRAQETRFNVPMSQLPVVGTKLTQGFMAYNATGPVEPWFGSTAYVQISSPKPGVTPYAATSTVIAGYNSLSGIPANGLAYDVSGMALNTGNILNLTGEGPLPESDPRFQQTDNLFYYYNTSGQRSEKRTYVGGTVTLINRSTGLPQASGTVNYLTLLLNYDTSESSGWGEIVISPGSSLHTELTSRFGSALMRIVGVTNTSPIFEDSHAGTLSNQRYAVYNASFSLIPGPGSPLGMSAAAAAGVVVTDTLPGSVSFVSAIPSQGSVTHSGATVTWNVGTLASGANASLTMLVVPTTAASITNTASVTASIQDSDPANNSVMVTTQVLSVNLPPVATDDSYGVNEDTVLNVSAPGVLGNDSDPNSDPLTAMLVSGPTKGALTLNANGSFSYTPNANANGADSFTYKASDGTLNSNTATVSITITPVNDAPVANAQSATTAEDTQVAITLTGSDVDGDPLTFAVGTPPTKGTLSGSAPSITYTPNANASGADSFSFTASDASMTSAPATVSISITPVNDAPVANAQSVTTAEDTTVSITLTGSDPDGDTLTFSIATPPAKGSLTGTAPNLTYTPNPNANGPDSFSFTVNDGTVPSAPATVSITVTPVNDAPVANAGPDQTVNEGTLVTLSGSASDVDGDAVVLAWTQTSGPVVTLSNPSIPAPTFTAPQVDADTVLTFELRVSDGKAAASDTVNVTVRNGAPTTFELARTIGYWKNHENHVATMLAQSTIALSDTTVTAVKPAVAVLSNASAKDARDSLRARLLASILNLRNNVNPNVTGADVRPIVDSARGFLATHATPVEGRHPDRDQALRLKDRLEAFNASGGG